MPLNLRALIVILGIAIPVFIAAKPICLRFMAEDDFARRRNVWFVLTLAGLICPSFWLYLIVAVPLLVWSARKDTNPVALYVFVLFVIPPIPIDIPTVIINELFRLDNIRMLALVVLVPVAWRLKRSNSNTGTGRITLMDKLLLGYAGLVLMLFSPYESITNTLRRGFLFFIDTLVLYFVVSRNCTSRHAIVETMASFCMACAILAPLALFESLKGWLLYGGISVAWGVLQDGGYLLRDSTVRAEVTAGHAIRLGFVLAIAFGFWLYLRSRAQSVPPSRHLTFAVALWMWLGLLAAYSRGPWLVAVLIFFTFLAIGQNGSVRVFKALLISALLAGLVLVSPIGERVINNLPFIGSVDAENISYRKQLAIASWQLIQLNPFFGSPNVLLYLESLRQGQGIIDLVNAYASIAMFYGLVGLCLFLGPVMVGMWNVRQVVKSTAGSDSDLSMLGASIIACMSGTLLMLAAGGFNTVSEKMFYLLLGFAAAYARLGQVPQTDQARREPVRLDASPRRMQPARGPAGAPPR